jgi:transportin-3
LPGERICATLLTSHALQTTFDLEQVPPASRLALRSTLLTALAAYLEGPRVIRTQLCLTLAALALQLEPGSDPEWGDRVVPAMIERFGNDPSSVALLLEFLTALPEEITTNHRIPIDVSADESRAGVCEVPRQWRAGSNHCAKRCLTPVPPQNDRYKERASSLLSAHADEVLRILAMYIQAQGVCAARSLKETRCAC